MASLRGESSNSEQTAGSNKRKKARFVVYKNEDGSLDTSHLSPEDKAAYEAGRPAPSAAPPPPASAPAPEPMGEPINPAVIGMALNLLVSIEAAVVGQKLGVPQSVAQSVFTPRPPFDTAITDLATKVANKHGASLGPYSDEIALVAMIGMWQVSAFSELRTIVAEMAANKPAAPPPNVDHGKHKSPPEKPATAPPAPDPAPPASNVVSIDMLLGAHSATGSMAAGV